MALSITDALSSVQWKQFLRTKDITYPLMDLFTSNNHASPTGSISNEYKAYDDTTGTKTGLEDTVEADWNGSKPKVAEQIIRVTDNISKNTNIYNSVVNSKLLTPSMFIAIVNDIKFNIYRPVNRKLFKTILLFFEKAITNAKTSVTISGDPSKVKDDMKLVVNEIKDNQANDPSWDTGLKDGDGNALIIENVLKKEDTLLYLDTNYKTSYNFDYQAQTYNVGDLVIPVSEIREINFSKLLKYETSVVKTGALLGFAISKEFFTMVTHYKESVATNNPKLYQVITHFMEFGLGTMLDEYFIPIIKTTT